MPVDVGERGTRRVGVATRIACLFQVCGIFEIRDDRIGLVAIPLTRPGTWSSLLNASPLRCPRRFDGYRREGRRPENVQRSEQYQR